MHKCIACGNSSTKTKHSNPKIIYHKLPRNANLRKKWLEVFKIDDNCSLWRRVCSNHFLKENYKPGSKKPLLYKNTIPLPYQKCDQNGFPNNNTIQSKDDKIIILPMEQNILNGKDTENIVIKAFESSRQLSKTIKSTRTYEDMNCHEHFPKLEIQQSEKQIPTVIKTDIKSEFTATKDHILDNGVCCFIPNCYNRLRPDAVPSLSLDYDIINSKNMPSTSSNVNSGLVPVNKPSCSSSDYVTKVDSDNTPLLVYIDSTNRSIKDFDPQCSIPGCITNIDELNLEEIPFFAPPIESLNDWSLSLGLHLTMNSLVCGRHFRMEDMLYPELLVNGSKKVIKSLEPDALPIPINDIRSTSNARNNVSDNRNKCSTSHLSMSIDDFSTIQSNLKEKLKNISTNCSLSVSLESVENSKVIEPPMDLFSKSSMSITIEPKFKHKLPSTTNNSFPSVSSTHTLPSILSCSANNLSKQSLLQHGQEATSTIKIPDKFFFNTVPRPKFIENQKKSLKSISATNKTPVILKRIPLSRKSYTQDSNVDYSKYSSQHIIIIDDSKTKNVKEKDNGFIFEISKIVEFPNLLWKSIHISAKNETNFYQQDEFGTIVKKINFHNSLVPIIKIHDKKYEFNNPIKSLNQLNSLLKKIDNTNKFSDEDKYKPRLEINHPFKKKDFEF